MCEFLYSPDRIPHNTAMRSFLFFFYFFFISLRVPKSKICFHSCGQLRNWKKKIQSLSLDCISNWKFDESFFISTKWKGKVEKFDFVPPQNEKTKNKNVRLWKLVIYYIVLGCCYTPCFCFYIRSLINTLIQVPPYKDLKKKKRKKERNQLQTQITLLTTVVQRSLHIYKCDYSISGLFKAEIST